MSIFSKFGFRRSRLPLPNARNLALDQLVCIHGITLDLRWAMVQLALHAIAALCILAQAQLASLVCRIVYRGSRRCTADVAAADTMVAAGGR